MKPIEVLIVDDQHLFAESLKFVLDGESKGHISVVGVAKNGEEALRFVSHKRPDVILMDIRMPVMDGVEATRTIHRDFPKINIIILTTFDDDELAIKALSQGAMGYIVKDVDPSDLIRCIEAVYNGGYYVSPSVGTKLFSKPGSHVQDEKSKRENTILLYLSTFPELSKRECDVLFFVAKAYSNRDIAMELKISEKTVKNHLGSIYEKLGVHGRIQLLNKALNAVQEGD